MSLVQGVNRRSNESPARGEGHVNRTVSPLEAPIRGTIRVPGDKSISHRAFLIASLAEGTSRIDGALVSRDVEATRRCLELVGAEFNDAHGLVTIRGSGLRGLQPPRTSLDCARSGTTMRLLAGLLAGQPFDSVLTGDRQLLRRPMQRVIEPLTQMGARIESVAGRAPLRIHGTGLIGAAQQLNVASAQVKSALILAGLTADGATVIHEPGPARDHTERILRASGARVHSAGGTIHVTPVDRLNPIAMSVPGDVSAAAFWIVAATLIPGSRLRLPAVGLNPTRTGLIDVLRRMGGRIEVENERIEAGEPVGTMLVEGCELRGTDIGGETVVRMIDEFPILAVAATQARGQTTVRDATELRVKESDRIASTVTSLRRLGARIEARSDGFVIEGPTRLHGQSVDGRSDHRLIMALAIAGAVAEGPVTIKGAERVEDSYPGFFAELDRLQRPT